MSFMFDDEGKTTLLQAVAVVDLAIILDSPVGMAINIPSPFITLFHVCIVGSVYSDQFTPSTDTLTKFPSEITTNFPGKPKPSKSNATILAVLSSVTSVILILRSFSSSFPPIDDPTIVYVSPTA